MKFTPLVLCALLLSPALSFAEDITLNDGTEYKDVTVIRVDEDGIVVETKDGVEKIPAANVPKEVQLVHPYKPPTSPATPAPMTTVSPVETPMVQSAVKPLPTPGQPAENNSKGIGFSAAGDIPAGLCGLFAKGGVAFVVLFATILVASFFARRLLRCAAARQKQRDFETGNAQQFHTAYTDFFAICKLWSQYLDHGGTELPDHGDNEIPHATRWELLTRAYIAEGAVETVFLKLSAARKLTPGEIELLGRFRQGFQTLGLAIKANKPLAWKDPEHPDFLVFKRLLTGVTALIGGENLGAQAADLRADAFRQITSNRWERSWSSDSSHQQGGK